MSYKTKLIEVALPLEAINRESAREKSIQHGHPSTLHPWWARRPLAACRAVLFASLVDDPSAHPDRFPTEADQEVERKRLFGILEDLVLWENTTKPHVLEAARAEILASCDGNPPPVVDPFCGGGSIPLEAQRLGLEAYASDLNPVAVLITKALVEIPPRFANQPPVHPQDRGTLGFPTWEGARGLAADIRFYGDWMRTQAEHRIGHLYPKVTLPKEHGGGEATVIAWLWARTVTCPNPACGAEMPLVRSFALSTKRGKQAWVEPIVDSAVKTVRFEVRTGSGKVPDAPKVGRGVKFRCLVCGQIAPDQHIKDEGAAGRMHARLMAVVAKGQRQRIYLSPDPEHEEIAQTAKPSWAPEERLAHDPRAIWCVPYGMTRHRDLFTNRQLVALTTFTDLVQEARDQVLKDATAAGLTDDGLRFAEAGTGATAYADAVATYLALAASKATAFYTTLARWRAGEGKSAPGFGGQEIPIVWDFAEVNPFAGAGGDWSGIVNGSAVALERLSVRTLGQANQRDAASALERVEEPLVCTDPPYYDNIGYADLSDFFYVWLRKSLRDVHPHLFETMLTPKAEEIVATPYRFGGDRRLAEDHFQTSLSRAFCRIREAQAVNYPTTLFYAFKQAEQRGPVSGIASTGWETMLEALLRAGLMVIGTWPMRTEMRTRQSAMGTNALASSVVLVCRPRPEKASMATRRDFLAALRSELPDALRLLQHGNIAPVDLAQASIGPGMKVFSRYSRVVEADGSAMGVRAALALINHVLDEILAEQEGDFDPETRWAVAWFEGHGMDEGPYGDADSLARAKDTATNAMVEAGILHSGRGKVRLLSRDELPDDWDVTTDARLTVWEVTQHLVRAVERSEQEAADLLRQVGGLGETARELAYRLYMICERKGRAQDAVAYNSLVVAWPELVRLAAAPARGVQEMWGE